MRVVFLVIDAFPHAALSETATPNLWQQGLGGYIAPNGGESLMLSVTYSNHAAFMTGLPPTQTGHWGNWAWVNGEFMKTYDSGPRGSTIIQECAARELKTVAIVGDHKLLRTMGALDCDYSWPPKGDPPPGAPLDAYGYPTDDAVIQAAGNADLDADFILLHLNEPDTSMHCYGPHSEETIHQYTKSDDSYGFLIELLRPQWDETILITVSDHCQEPTEHPECVNLRDHAKELGWPVHIRNDGTGAIVCASEDIGDGEFEVLRKEILNFEGIEDGVSVANDVLLIWTEPQRMFGRGEPMTRGNHGSIRCTQQLSMVSGGHPGAQQLGRSITSHRPGTLTWAPVIRNLLEL